MEFTPTKSPKEENEILTYVQLEQNNSEENNNNNEQNNPFNNSPLKYYCSDITEIDKQNENGWTPIYRAIIANNLNALKELLKFGANPNLQNNIGETPLYLCVDIDNYDAIVILLEKNADCNISKKDGTSPLHLATKKKKEKFIKILLEHGANPNLINKLYSQTSLHLAIKNKLGEDILLLFKKYGANIFEIKDRYEKTSYDYAKELYDENYLNMINSIFENKEDNLNTNEIIINNNNDSDNNNNKNITNLNSIFKNIELNKNENNIDNDLNKDKNENINEIKTEQENKEKKKEKKNKKMTKEDIKNKVKKMMNKQNKIHVKESKMGNRFKGKKDISNKMAIKNA